MFGPQKVSQNFIWSLQIYCCNKVLRLDHIYSGTVSRNSYTEFIRNGVAPVCHRRFPDVGDYAHFCTFGNIFYVVECGGNGHRKLDALFMDSPQVFRSAYEWKLAVNDDFFQ